MFDSNQRRSKPISSLKCPLFPALTHSDCLCARIPIAYLCAVLWHTQHMPVRLFIHAWVYPFIVHFQQWHNNSWEILMKMFSDLIWIIHKITTFPQYNTNTITRKQFISLILGAYERKIHAYALNTWHAYSTNNKFSFNFLVIRTNMLENGFNLK